MLEKYELLEEIGQGSFGVIHKVRRKADNMIFVRKDIHYGRMSSKERQQMVNEVNILNRLRHPNIVRYHERHLDRDARIIYIVMEFCSGGDLAAIIRHYRAKGQHIPEETVWQLFSQILLALHECHQGWVVKDANEQKESRAIILHRDIKPDNIFLDENHNVKLGDFGLSRAMESHEQLARTFLGTPFYMSPEIINGAAYDTKTDIWSLGCLIYEVCALHPPFPATNLGELNDKIRRGIYPELPREYSSDLKQIISMMLRQKPEARPSTSDCLDHPRIRRCATDAEIQHLREKMRLVEIEAKQRVDEVNRREEQLGIKEKELNAREQDLHAREATLLSREAALLQQSDQLKKLQEELEDRERRAGKSWLELHVGGASRRAMIVPYTRIHRPRKRPDLLPNVSDGNLPAGSRSTDAMELGLRARSLDEKLARIPPQHTSPQRGHHRSHPIVLDEYGHEDDIPSPFIKRHY